MPNCLMSLPTRVRTLTISAAFEFALSERWLTASPNMPILGMGICKTLDSVAIDSPACPAAISNATPILAVFSAKPVRFSRATPDCPPAATMAAMSLPAIGILRVIFKMSRSISLNCCGVSKLTTFLTSAIADSNSIEALTGKINVPAAASAPCHCPLMSVHWLLTAALWARTALSFSYWRVSLATELPILSYSCHSCLADDTPKRSLFHSNTLPSSF